MESRANQDSSSLEGSETSVDSGSSDYEDVPGIGEVSDSIGDSKEDDLAPLVGNLEIDSSEEDDEQQYGSGSHRGSRSLRFKAGSSVWSPKNKPKIILVLILGCMILLSLLFGQAISDSDSKSRSPSDEVLWTDLTPKKPIGRFERLYAKEEVPYSACFKDRYTESFVDFMDRIHNSTQGKLCNKKMLKELGKTSCTCYNPTIPLDHSTSNIPFRNRQWDKAVERTKKLAAVAQARSPLDVVFLGDAIVESWAGTSTGIKHADLEGIFDIFENIFNKEKGGRVNGVPLGVSGDRISQVLDRVENDGFGDLNPRVFWLQTGSNDLANDFCSEESIVAGIIAVTESIIDLRPNSTVVINSLLPRARYIGEVIASVNKRLKCYAKGTEHNVVFFNSTAIFADPTSSSKTQHLVDIVHPDEEGTLQWLNAIAQKVMSIH